MRLNFGDLSVFDDESLVETTSFVALRRISVKMLNCIINATSFVSPCSTFNNGE